MIKKITALLFLIFALTGGAYSLLEDTTAFGSVTGSYVAAVTIQPNTHVLFVQNSTDANILVSLDSGTSTAWTMAPSDSFTLDMQDHTNRAAPTQGIYIKHDGTAATTGNFYIRQGRR
jgi:hypothetical protein